MYSQTERSMASGFMRELFSKRAGGCGGGLLTGPFRQPLVS
jgi:hypothetical protein